MPYSYNLTGGEGPGDILSVPFPYLQKEHIYVEVDDVLISNTKYEWPSEGQLLLLSGFPVGSTTKVYRKTPFDERVGDLQGSAFLAFDDVNNNDKQMLYVLQETADAEASRQAAIDNLSTDLEAAETARVAAEAARAAAEGYSTLLAAEKSAVLLNRVSSQETILLADGQPDANPDAVSSITGLLEDQVPTWKAIVAGIPVHHPKVTALIYAGDVADRGYPSEAEEVGNTQPWYTLQQVQEDLRSLPFSEIDIIGGNHDNDSRPDAKKTSLDPFGYFLTVFPKQFYYKIKGNTCYIYMGDMGDLTQGVITDYVFEWWVNVCEKFSSYNKIVVTHQILPNVGMGNDTYTPTNGNLIGSGQRFIDKMTAATNPIKIDAWISGHTNFNTASNPDHQHKVAHGGCLFVNVGLHIHADLEGGPGEITYVKMCTTSKSKDVVFKRWNHKTGAYIVSAEVTHEFSNAMVLEVTPSFDGRFTTSELDLQRGKKTHYTSIELDGGGVSYDMGPYWLQDLILDDRSHRNIPKGIQVGARFNLAGNNNDNEDYLIHGYGTAGAVTARKSNETDTDYSADVVLYASGPARDDSSLVEVLAGYPDGSVSSPQGMRRYKTSGWLNIANNGHVQLDHNLNDENVQCRVRFRTGSGARIYDVSSSNFDITNGGRYMCFISQDANSVYVDSGNDGPFSKDNTEGNGSTTNYTSGQVMIDVWSVPLETVA